MRALVSATYLYPIKACAPLRVAALAFEPAGDIRGDREWVVVDADDRVTWQGAIPRLAQIIPAGTPDALALWSEAGDTAVLPPPGQGTPRTVQAWNAQRQAFDALAGHDAGDTVAGLASKIAGQPIRIVHVATTTHRPHPVHIISETSVGALSAQLGRTMDPLRFRPNIVLSGDGEPLPPFCEEQASALAGPPTGAQLELKITAPCERCIVVNADPDTSAVDDRYLKTVAAHSRGRGVSAPAAFGVYARATTGGTLATGDRVELIPAHR